MGLYDTQFNGIGNNFMPEMDPILNIGGSNSGMNYQNNDMMMNQPYAANQDAGGGGMFDSIMNWGGQGSEKGNIFGKGSNFMGLAGAGKGMFDAYSAYQGNKQRERALGLMEDQFKFNKMAQTKSFNNATRSKMSGNERWSDNDISNAMI